MAEGSLLCSALVNPENYSQKCRGEVVEDAAVGDLVEAEVVRA
jgi:hypothetical protein